MTDIELIKSKLDIVDVISTYLPNLKKAGANYKTNCPFHNEKTASFTVNPSLQIYKCFGCGKGGDLINFIQEFERLDFPEAIKISAQKAGIELTNKGSQKSKKEDEEKKKALEANMFTAKYYHYILNTHKSGLAGKAYAQKRGLDQKVINKFMVGYAPNNKDNLKKFLITKGFIDKDLMKWGLLVERNGVIIDKFRNRLMQPIFNIKGDVVGFSGRYIGTNKEAPKYLNSPETIVYKKNEMLYGLFHAKEAMRKKGYVVLEEGNIDILSSHRVGVENIVAPLGTAFTENQAKLLKRFVDEIYFCFDTDAAGVNALVKGIGILEELGLKHRIIDVRPFKDPDELIMKDPKEWDKRIENSRNSMEYLIELFSKELDLGSADGKVKFSERILPVLRLIRDPILLSHFAKEISVMLEIEESIVLERIKDRKKIIITPEKVSDSKLTSVKDKEDKIELYLLALIVNLDKVDYENIPIEIFSDKNLKEIYEHILNGEFEDPAELYEKISEDAKPVFEQVMLFDLTKIENLRKELDDLSKSIREKNLKSKFRKLGKDLKMNSEHTGGIEKLQVLLDEMRQIKK